MATKREESVVPSIIDLSAVRDALAVPTEIAAMLATRAGLTLVAVRPGQVEASMPTGDAVLIRVSRKNIYLDEAEAYRLCGKPVPAYVLEDAIRWEEKYGGRQT